MKDLHAERAVTMAPASILSVADENPRSNHSVSPSEIDELADNIEEQGVLTPLIGYETAGRFHVTAGGRRTRAIKQLVEQDRIDPEFQVPVFIMPIAEAISAGVAEQITHKALTPLDELRVFSYYDAATTDADLARIVGKSAKYVAQRRLILSLPQEVLDYVMDGYIEVHQAAGLTYWMDDLDGLFEMADYARSNSRITGDEIRRRYLSSLSEWDKSPWTKFVTRDEYRDAGGELQEDLFADTAIVKSPSLLEQLALHAIQKKIEADHPGRPCVEYVEELFGIPVHPGLSQMTDDEQEEWSEIRHDEWRHDEDEEPEWFARYRELEAKAEPLYPDELRSLLAVYWTDASWNDDGYRLIDTALPDDLEPLYDGGWLNRPSEIVQEHGESEPEAAEEKPKVSSALRTRIDLITAHVVRQELVAKPDATIALYLWHIQAGNTYGAPMFMPTPERHYDIGEKPVQYSKAWLNQLERENLTPDQIVALKPAEQRKYMAFKMLKCLTTHLDATTIAMVTGLRIDANVVRKYFSLDASFFAAYQKPVLLEMLNEDLSSDAKKKGLCDRLAKHADDNPDWLPVGFHTYL